MTRKNVHAALAKHASGKLRKKLARASTTTVKTLVQGQIRRVKQGKKLNKPLSPEAKRDLVLLRTVWDKRAKAFGLTQANVAARSGVGKSTVEQYLQGMIPLNVKWMLIFSVELQLLPQEIWPQWPFATITANRVPIDLTELLPLWMKLDLEGKRGVVKLICEQIKRIERTIKSN